MNAALIGSVSSSERVLQSLIEHGAEVTAVCGLGAQFSGGVSDFRDICRLAESHGIPHCSFRRVNEPQVREMLLAHKPDLLFVIGISQLVPDSIIDIATVGGIGFHPTMLPRGRGRAPVAWTILLNERPAASLFFLSDEPDSGDLIARREVELRPDDYAQTLIDRTNDVLAQTIADLAPGLSRGELPRMPQNHALATYYGKRTAADGMILWSNPAEKIRRLIRAASKPYPGAFSFFGEKRLTCWRAEVIKREHSSAEPGLVLATEADGAFEIQTGCGTLRVTEWELENECTDHVQPGSRLSHHMELTPARENPS